MQPNDAHFIAIGIENVVNSGHGIRVINPGASFDSRILTVPTTKEKSEFKIINLNIVKTIKN